MERRFDIPPLALAEAFGLQRELGVSFPLAQVLARRGLGEPAAARSFLTAGERHDPSAFAGIDTAVALVLGHVEAGSRITVHGDYDVDGVCSTAILVATLRALGADVDSYLPSRTADGYGLNAHTVTRLAERGTRLLITADCAITAVDEVAQARSAGMDVVVTDHHAPRADGVLPVAPIVHPGVCGYPCVDLCAAGVAHKLAGALLGGAGRDPGEADADLDLVALATVADCVPLRGENRRLVREGLVAIARSRRPGLRALMRVARVDPGSVDAGSIGFRLAPRINAAGRLYRADAGLELMLTTDDERAGEIAAELDAANGERRAVEQRIRWEAEAQLAEAGEQAAYVLAGEDWHPGVIGIVASRIAEQANRPCVLVALGGEEGTASGRSIEAFDLLGGLNAAAAHLVRHGGHRAAAGATVRRDALDAFRAAFVAHAEQALAGLDLTPAERVDAVVSGDELGLELAEELGRLAPFGIGNPAVSLLVPAARLADQRRMGEEGRHVRFSVEAGGHRARAVAFNRSSVPGDGPVDATFALEINEYNGAVEPRLLLRCAQPSSGGEIALAGEPADPVQAALAELTAPLPATDAPAAGGRPRDRRGGGVAGTIGALVGSGEPVLVICADARRRAAHLAGRLGGFTMASWDALERDPGLAARYAHVVALDPPAAAAQAALLSERFTLAWGEPERAFALVAHESAWDIRPAAAAVFRTLRAGGALADAVDAAPSPAAAGRALRVLADVGLVLVGGSAGAAVVPDAPRTDLDRSLAQRAFAERLTEGRARLAAPAGDLARAA